MPNIVAFAWPGAAMIDYTVIGASGANAWAHRLTGTLFLGKFMFLFSMLFGAGVVLYARKFDERDERPRLTTGAWLWYRRCAVLLVFGLIHAYLFWYGDILTWYAAAGLTLLWWVRRLRIGTQIAVAGASYLAGMLLMLGFMLLGLWAVDQGHMERSELVGTPPEREIAAYLGTNEIGQRSGPWVSALAQRVPTTLMMHLIIGPFYLPMLWGMMMLGMALTRTRILTGERPRGFYLKWTLILLPVGLALTIGARWALGAALGTGFRASFVWQSAAQGVGVPLALGYAALVIWVTKTGAMGLATRALAGVGRMALTNYILQTLVCTTLFYGYGFGYFAHIEFPALWLVVIGVWGVNIVFSALWLRAFRFGPLEWVWRCATYGQVVPIRVKNA